MVNIKSYGVSRRGFGNQVQFKTIWLCRIVYPDFNSAFEMTHSLIKTHLIFEKLSSRREMNGLILYKGSCPALPEGIACVLSTRWRFLSIPENRSLLIYLENTGVSLMGSVDQYSGRLDLWKSLYCRNELGPSPLKVPASIKTDHQSNQ